MLKLFVKLLTNLSDKSSFGLTSLPNIRLATSCTAFMTGYYTGDCPLWCEPIVCGRKLSPRLQRKAVVE